MKKRSPAPRDLADRLTLPREALGAARLTVTGGRQVLLENHRGLLSYAPELIHVSLGQGSLRFLGSGLCLRAMSREALVIEGSLRAIEWE